MTVCTVDFSRFEALEVSVNWSDWPTNTASSRAKTAQKLTMSLQLWGDKLYTEQCNQLFRASAVQKHCLWLGWEGLAAILSARFRFLGLYSSSRDGRLQPTTFPEERMAGSVLWQLKGLYYTGLVVLQNLSTPERPSPVLYCPICIVVNPLDATWRLNYSLSHPCGVQAWSGGDSEVTLGKL